MKQKIVSLLTVLTLFTGMLPVAAPAALAAARAVDGEIDSIYKLGDGLYYVVITVNGEPKGILATGITQNREILWQTGEGDSILFRSVRTHCRLWWTSWTS